MPLPDLLERARQAVRAHGLPGWLMYDFLGINPLVKMLLEIPEQAHLSRRFFIWIPADGEPCILHNVIEGGTWEQLAAGTRRIGFAGGEQLRAGLRQLLAGVSEVAMEYSPLGEVPYVSRVDAGTVELLRSLGVEPVSSAELIQDLLVWNESDLHAHMAAAEALAEGLRSSLSWAHRQLAEGLQVSEAALQGVLTARIRESGMTEGHPPIVAFGAHAADPHYSGAAGAALERGQCVLIDLWCCVPGQVQADMTWMAVWGPASPRLQQIWELVAEVRDAAISRIEQEGSALQGWQLDRQARDRFAATGLEQAFTHRLGHNLHRDVHGPGANLDDLEAHDLRKLHPRLAYTVEPGLYLPEEGVGVRSEVDVYMDPAGPRVTTRRQRRLIDLAAAGWEGELVEAGLG